MCASYQTAKDQTVQISAVAARFQGGFAMLDVTDHETLTVSIDLFSIRENGGTATGTVRRGNTDIASALSVNLFSGDMTEPGRC